LSIGEKWISVQINPGRGSLYEGGDLFKCSLSIVSCGGDVLKAGEKHVAAGVHGPNIAKRDKLFP
jgi:hypothetical protein